MIHENSPQSTNHIFMIEPRLFRSNPETLPTNNYQHKDDKDDAVIQKLALEEFRAFRDLLIEHDVIVTTVKGQENCPDDIFPNWFSTHYGEHGGRLILYPMSTPNRQAERRNDVIKLLKKTYKDVQDFSLNEQLGKSLEATSVLVLDRVHKIAYQIRSNRANDEVAGQWADMNGYKLIRFDTDYKGKPVYHADVVLWIGTDVAGVASECLIKDDIVKHLKARRDVIEFSNEQKAAFCGNSLEVLSNQGERMLVMSDAGYNTLNDVQKMALGKHYKTIIKPKIPTIEYYGGGSVRCMLCELF